MLHHALLIEDDPRIAEVLELELARAGWGVTWHAAGQPGLDACRAGSYDLVILDLMLPDRDGVTVCRAIRAETPLPILILTARDAVPERVRGLDAGADDYLTKPFATSELLARMRALTRRSATQASQEGDWLRVGQLRLSAMRHAVRAAGVPVELTRREFSLLDYFMHNAGITLTRDMILERVWGWTYTGSITIVDVYVGYLRHKVPWELAGSELLTVRGVGYVLREATS
jgi:DNA-binding response OmpR family regulator